MPVALPLLCLAAYLVGAVPFGLLVTRLFVKRDIREVGSGNIGATNVVRAAGRGAGALTLLLDGLKGAVAAFAGLHFFGPLGGALAGGAAFLGHLFPAYIGFRGGKGVATGVGIFAVLNPLSAAIALATYAVVFAVSRVSALGSLAGVATLGATVLLTSPPPVVTLFCLSGSLVLLRHRANLLALWRTRSSSKKEEVARAVEGQASDESPAPPRGTASVETPDA
jgi:glycerol-3-phosphate acyltransferase PlsY